MANMNGTKESGTNGAEQVKLGAPYKAYTAAQVNARQVVVIGVYQDVARYKQVGAYMRESTEAIEKVGLGPGMNLTVGGANTKLPTVVFLADAVRPKGWVENFAEVQIGLEGAETMVELRGEWKERIEIEAAVAEAVAISQNWKKTSGETIPVHIEPNAARFGVEMRDVAAVGFEAGEDKVKTMIEALSKEAAYGGLRHWGLVGGGGQSGLAAGTWFSPLKKIAFPGTKVLNVIGFDMASFQGNGGLGRPLGVLRGELGNVTIAKAIKQPGCVKTARVTVNFPLKEFASVERQLAACTKKALEGHPITVGLELMKVVLRAARERTYRRLEGRVLAPQLGWLQGCATAHVGVQLQVLMQQAARVGHTLYVCYVDLSTFFPSIDRFLLNEHELRAGVPIDVLNLAAAIFGAAEEQAGGANDGCPCRYDSAGGLGDAFQNNMGALMGCVLSPNRAKTFVNSVIAAIHLTARGVRVWGGAPATQGEAWARLGRVAYV